MISASRCLLAVGHGLARLREVGLCGGWAAFAIAGLRRFPPPLRLRACRGCGAVHPHASPPFAHPWLRPLGGCALTERLTELTPRKLRPLAQLAVSLHLQRALPRNHCCAATKRTITPPPRCRQLIGRVEGAPGRRDGPARRMGTQPRSTNTRIARSRPPRVAAPGAPPPCPLAGQPSQCM